MRKKCLSRGPSQPLTIGLLLALSLSLAACDQVQAPSEEAALVEAAPPSAPAPQSLQQAGGMGAGAQADLAAEPAAAERHIAVRQMLTVESPGDQLPDLFNKVRSQCGTLRCELLTASLRQETPRQAAGASLSLRVAPEDADKLLAALQGGGAVIVQQDTHSEDLTAQVIDVQAHIRNRTEFRDSLRALLARPDAQRALKDLLEIQRTLTQTQAELDSHAAQLKALQSRTRMQQIDIEFRAERRVVSGGGSNPIARAWEQAGETLAYSAAAVITFVAAALPWAVVAVPFFGGLGVLARAWRRRRARRTGA